MNLKQKVLIVDDNPHNIRLVADSLKELNLALTFATDGFKAINVVRNESIDLILMDIMMPEMDGFQTVDKLQYELFFDNIPIIFLTAIDDKESIVKAFDKGGIDYITKPFHPKELLSRVKTHLNLRKLNKSLSQEVSKKSQELENSIFIEHSSGAFNSSKLNLDLFEDKNRIGAILHIKKIYELEIAFGLEVIEQMVKNLVLWLENQKGVFKTIYRISFADIVILFKNGNQEKVENWSKNTINNLKKLEIELLNKQTISLNYIFTLAIGNSKNLLTRLRIGYLEAYQNNINYFFFKGEEKNRVKQQEKNIYWIKYLKKSFENDTIIPYFQPIVNIKTKKILKYEVLARIKDKDNLIYPIDFIKVAKQLGVITEITKRILKKSCKVFSNSSLSFSINITKEDLVEGYLEKMLEELTTKHNLKKEQITLEILEEVSVFGNDEIVSSLLKLQKKGYKIALDDFGAENASFSRMLDLKLDSIKIDAIFIKDIDEHKNSMLIVQGIVHLAKLFNYEVIAEHVHKKEVLDMVESLGIKQVQGYYFSPPIAIPKELE